MNYGMKAKNPMDYVLFYEKEEPNETILIPKQKVTAPWILSLATFTYLCIAFFRFPQCYLRDFKSAISGYT